MRATLGIVASGRSGVGVVIANQTINFGSTTDTTTYASGTFTPTGSNNLVIVAFVHGEGIHPTADDATSVTGTSVTGMAKITSKGYSTIATPTRRVHLWAGKTTASAGAVTITLPNNPSGCLATLIEITGADTTVGTAGIVQSASNASDTNTTSNTVTLSAFANAGNGALAIFCSNQATSNTPKAGWTELADSNVTLGNLTREVQFIASNDTTPSATAANTGQYGAIAVEIAVA